MTTTTTMTVLEALRILTSFTLPRRRPTSAAQTAGVGQYPWLELVGPAVLNGVAPLVAYNMEYRLGGGGAPEEAHDQLLGYYQGTQEDTIYKLVNLKRLLDPIEAPVMLLEAAAYADAIYPHIAFRPVPEIRLLARRADFPKLVAAGKPHKFREKGEEDGALVLSDGRTRFLIYDALGGAEAGLLERGLRAKAYGPGALRPSIEDAIVTHLALMAKGGFESPLIEFVDLRELVTGSPGQGGTYEAVPDAAVVKSRAEAAGLSRALYCAMSLLAWFFPEVAAQAKALTPELSLATRTLLDAAVVHPGQRLDRMSVNVGAEAVRKALTGN